MFELPEISLWGWLLIGMMLLAIELIAPFAFFLWLGVSALLTALILFLFPTTIWQVQGLIFSMLAVVSVILSRRYLVHRQTESEIPNLNRRAQQYVGKVFILIECIEHGHGKIKVDDTYWQVSGPKLEKGSEVRITHVNGAVFTVEKAD